MSYIPMVVEQTSRGERSYDIFSRLLNDRVIILSEDGLPCPLSRQAIGLEPRRCLLCDNEARFCMRARTHTVEALLEKISCMVRDYSQ